MTRALAVLDALLVVGCAPRFPAQVGIGGACASGGPVGSAEHLTRVGAMLSAYDAGISYYLGHLPPNPEVRGMVQVSLGALELGRPEAEVEPLLRTALDSQYPDGQFPWYVHPTLTESADNHNAVEFVSQPLGPLLKRFGACLSSELHAYLDSKASAALPMLRQRTSGSPPAVPPWYTNIFLMNTVDLILLGEAVGDADAAAAGYSNLDAWMAFTGQNGITEYDSPTYYAADLDSLYMGALYADDPGGRDKFQRSLEYFFTDIGANLFEPRGSLSGPHSRDYDFLAGRGQVERYLYIVGWRDLPGGTYGPDACFLVLNELDRGFEPADALRGAGSQPFREVLQTWGAGGANTRTNYVTPMFSIGGASADYADVISKDIDIELSLPEPQPNISVVVDDSNTPYGLTKELGPAGFSKPSHLPLNPLIVQKEGLMLALLVAQPRPAGFTTQQRDGGPTTLSTDVILPLTVQSLQIDGASTSALVLPGGGVVSAGLNSLATLIQGDAGVAIRLLAAESCTGGPPAISLQTDSTGQDAGAALFRVEHWRPYAGALDAGCSARVAWLFSAGTPPGNADIVAAAQVAQASDGGLWTVSVQVAGHVLAGTLNISTLGRVSATVDGAPLPTGRLQVNGVDLASPLLP